MASISSMDGRFSPADTVLAPTEAVCIGLSARTDNDRETFNLNTDNMNDYCY